VQGSRIAGTLSARQAIDPLQAGKPCKLGNLASWETWQAGKPGKRETWQAGTWQAGKPGKRETWQAENLASSISR
jgi:hypothetical protein